MTKRLFDQAHAATLEEQLELEARAPDGCDGDRGLRGGRRRLPREAPAALQRPLSVRRADRTVDYHTGGEPFRIVTGGVGAARRAHDPRQAPRRARAARRRPASCSSTSRAGTRTCTAASSSSRRTTAPTSASSSSTTRATRPRAGTGRSRSSPGRSRAGVIERARGRERASSSTSPRAGSRPGRASRAATCARCASATCPRSSGHCAGGEVDVAFGGAFYARVEERVEPRELPRLIELGRAIKGERRGRARRRPPARAGAARHLRRDLLAAGGRRPAADAAERHRLRRRRGRPLAVRQRHVGAARAAGRAGPPRRGDELLHRSIVGTEFRARIVGDADVAGIPAVVTEVEGAAFRTGWGRSSSSIATTRPARVSLALS